MEVEATTQATFKNYWGEATEIVADDVHMTGIFELAKGGRYIAEIDPTLTIWLGGVSKLSAKKIQSHIMVTP